MSRISESLIRKSIDAENDENPPVGLILCTRKDASVAHYALEGLPNKVLAAEYRTALPDADRIAAELTKARLAIESRGKGTRRRGQP